ncbi:LANO_0D08086g1_1 [Lachancea nothofagi CBS 11611]|uniref:LANO_0D08086g1_1 n=1 Tax=Lachancea nothofagi CBS 11611 TaxID=1266666 RepID=A0A1G4JIF0_9SACH|nr:LANO_0D08086g1_1 [Lachancea nothofagi CBS 11611]
MDEHPVTATGIALYKKPLFQFDMESKSGNRRSRERAEIPLVDPIVATPDKISTETSEFTKEDSHYTHTSPALRDSRQDMVGFKSRKQASSNSSSVGNAMPASKPAFSKSSSGSGGSTSGATSRPALAPHTLSSSSSSSLLSVSSASPYRANTRRLSSEEIINEMEKEQDAIVVRLLREIDQLKDENNRLRKNLGAVLNGDPQTPATAATNSTLPQLSRRSSLNSNASSASIASNNSSLSGANVNVNGSNSTSVLALTPSGTSPAPSRRPSSSAAPIDTLTPTLLLQRKRNSIPSPNPLTPKKSDEFVHLYTPVPSSNLVKTDPAADLPGSCGYRRRRLSVKSSEGSNKIQRSTQ